jgi:hypothetical protein
MKKLLLLLLIAPVLGVGQETFDSEKTFLSEYKDIARFVSISDYGFTMIAFGNYDKSSTLFPIKFFELDGDCYDCTEGWKVYVNELKCDYENFVCKIIINKPNVFVEKCQFYDSANNTNTVFQTEYSVLGDILTEKTTFEDGLDGKGIIIENLYRRDHTIKCCTKREIKEWEKKNVIPIDY